MVEGGADMNDHGLKTSRVKQKLIGEGGMNETASDCREH